MIIFFSVGIICLIAYFLWNPTTRRIREIQTLLNKDRSVCDFINSLNGWAITSVKGDGLKIIINPIVMPMYALYVTYKGNRPTNKEVKELYCKLTDEDSIVTIAHKANMPVENYIEFHNKN